MSDKEPQFFYRYRSQRYSVIVDAERDQYGTSNATLKLEEYIVLKETPCGHWITRYYKGFKSFDKHWVSKTSLKKYAYPTKEEALEGYRQKKRSFVRHARARLARAEEDLRLVDNPEWNEII